MRDRTRRFIGALSAVAVAAAVPVVTVALATTASAANCTTANVVTGSNFEIDTNGNLAVNGASPCIDWLEGGSGTALRSGVLTRNDKPTGSGDDAFGRGTAENDANPTIVAGSIPPNKSDLKVFGLFKETGSTSKFLELFWSRVQDPSGTTNMDFELNQKFCDPSANPTNCANNGVAVPETPLRTAGDKLITYDLANGGTVPIISIRTWGVSSWGAATVISGSGGTAAGSVNTTAMAATDTGGIGSQSAYTFGEAAISFANLFSSGTGTCGTFGSAYLKSRSSASFSAEIKDFISPQKVSISNCAGLSTSATATAVLGNAISDTATLSGTTANSGGTITFNLYSDAACTQEVTPTGLTAKTVNGDADYNSGNYTPTAVGTYYWIAHYSGDLNNSKADGTCGDAGESSVVSQVQPTIATSATASVTIGSPISDTATLSNATAGAGGTITFQLFSDSLCQNEVTTTLTPATVSGNGSYGSGNVTPTAVGTYYWIANYSGDTSNKAANGACGDTGESSDVGQVQPTIGTTATASVTIGSPISDSATLSGATASAGGTITFHLFSDSLCKNEVTTSLTPATVSGNGSYGSGNVTPTAVGTYYWIANYSGDTNNKAANGACGDTGESSVVNRAPSGIVTSQTITPQDSATISASAGGTPTGTVTFKLFGPNNATCDASGAAAVYTEAVTLTSGVANTTNTTFSVTSATASLYKWLVVYGGDTTHTGTTSACGTEQFTLTIKNS